MTGPCTDFGPAQPVPTTQVDVAAERVVLGGLMLTADITVVDNVMNVVDGEDFYGQAHADLFRILCRRHLNREPTDPVAVATELADLKSAGHASFLSRIGGAGYLHTLIQGVPTPYNVGYYARTVADKATRRRVTLAGNRIAQLGADGTVEVDRLVDLVLAETATVMPRTTRGLASFKDVLADVLAVLHAEKPAGGVSTGILDLEGLIGPLRPGQLILIAGRPGQGKTVLAADVARHVAIRQQRPVIYSTLEMSAQEMVLRNLSAESGIAYDHLHKGHLGDAEVAKLGRTLARIENAPFAIWDQARVGVNDLHAQARRFEHQMGGDLGLIVVDYIQLMKANTNLPSREQQVADLSRSLKLLARERNAPVIGVAQLNRVSETRTDKRPQLSDLRESGSLEQDADVVIMVHREDYYDPTARPGEADLMVVKNRHGPTGTVTVAAQLHLMRFVDLAIRY